MKRRWRGLKKVPAHVAEISRHLPVGIPLELCRRDEARAAQKAKLTRRSRGAEPGPEPSMIDGANPPISSARLSAALVLPRHNSQAMQGRRDEISSQVAPGGAQAILPLPPRSPELNPVENPVHRAWRLGAWVLIKASWYKGRLPCHFGTKKGTKFKISAEPNRLSH